MSPGHDPSVQQTETKQKARASAKTFFYSYPPPPSHTSCVLSASLAAGSRLDTISSRETSSKARKQIADTVMEFYDNNESKVAAWN